VKGKPTFPTTDGVGLAIQIGQHFGAAHYSSSFVDLMHPDALGPSVLLGCTCESCHRSVIINIYRVIMTQFLELLSFISSISVIPH
jgi:hypothetical protein